MACGPRSRREEGSFLGRDEDGGSSNDCKVSGGFFRRDMEQPGQQGKKDFSLVVENKGFIGSKGAGGESWPFRQERAVDTTMTGKATSSFRKKEPDTAKRERGKELFARWDCRFRQINLKCGRGRIYPEEGQEG